MKDMKTLKQLRLDYNLTQPQVGTFIGKQGPVISSYENGTATPDLEEMVILEQRFQSRIDWQEGTTPNRKREVVQSLIELCERYPIEAVVEFAARVYRRKQTPESFITHYAQVSQSEPESLLPNE
jgi:transcriptional regulator with XRE-family HTH domain